MAVPAITNIDKTEQKIDVLSVLFDEIRNYDLSGVVHPADFANKVKEFRDHYLAYGTFIKSLDTNSENERTRINALSENCEQKIRKVDLLHLFFDKILQNDFGSSGQEIADLCVDVLVDMRKTDLFKSSHKLLVISPDQERYSALNCVGHLPKSSPFFYNTVFPKCMFIFARNGDWVASRSILGSNESEALRKAVLGSPEGSPYNLAALSTVLPYELIEIAMQDGASPGDLMSNSAWNWSRIVQVTAASEPESLSNKIYKGILGRRDTLFDDDISMDAEAGSYLDRFLSNTEDFYDQACKKHNEYIYQVLSAAIDAPIFKQTAHGEQTIRIRQVLDSWRSEIHKRLGYEPKPLPLLEVY